MGRVIVVGGGGAGLIAALAAREAGAEVLLLSKAPAGLASCTAYAGGGFTLGIEGVSPEKHYDFTLKTGRFLNERALLEIMTKEAPEKVPALTRFGVRLDRRPGHISVARHAPNPFYGGMALTRPLLAAAKRAGVTIRNHFFVTRLLLADGTVRGVAGYDWKKNIGVEEEEIRGEAVILATGGAGRLYRRTDNPIRTTGDGYLLAWQAGAELQDMEFVQFYPLGFAEPGFPVWFISLRLIDLAPLTNERGERFLDPLLAEWGIKNGRDANLFARDRAAVAIARERRRGEVYLHLEKVPPENWDDPDLRGLIPLYPAWFPRWEKPVRVAPVEHYFAGGASIDPAGWTGVPGLFACGEVTGGVDGANRVGGNALTNLTVFGLRAGQAAARYAEGPATSRRGLATEAGGLTTGGVETFQPKKEETRDKEETREKAENLPSLKDKLGDNPASVSGAFKDRPADIGGALKDKLGDVNGTLKDNPAGAFKDKPGPAGGAIKHKPGNVDGAAGRFQPWNEGALLSTPLPDLTPSRLVEKWGSRQSGVAPEDLRRKINALAEAYLGPLRHGAALNEARSRLNELWDDLERQWVRNPSDLLLALENRSLLFVAQVVTEAAWQREESRGVHYRDDFPNESKEWEKHITLRRDGQRLVWGRKSVDA